MNDPAPHQDEMMQVPPLSRRDIGVLIVCVDRLLRQEGLMAGNLMAIAEKLAQATPIEVAADSNGAIIAA